MSEPKFSKGPWRIQWPVPSAGECRKIRTAEDTAIVGDATYYPSVPSKTADWFLIAAAPEMYGLLDEISDGLLEAGGYGNCALAKRIEDLLAKARGEL